MTLIILPTECNILNPKSTLKWDNNWYSWSEYDQQTLGTTRDRKFRGVMIAASKGHNTMCHIATDLVQRICNHNASEAAAEQSRKSDAAYDAMNEDNDHDHAEKEQHTL